LQAMKALKKVLLKKFRKYLMLVLNLAKLIQAWILELKVISKLLVYSGLLLKWELITSYIFIESCM